MYAGAAFPLAWSMHGGAGWGIGMMLGMFLFWGAVIVGIVWLVRDARRVPSAPLAPRETPIDILERRFAEGGLSAEDYRARREVLVHANTDEEGR